MKLLCLISIIVVWLVWSSIVGVDAMFRGEANSIDLTQPVISIAAR